MQILDVKESVDRTKLEERYMHLFEINDTKMGGSLYLQPKVRRKTAF